MRSSTKTDKTSEFTLLNVDSEVYLQSLPHANLKITSHPRQKMLPSAAETPHRCHQLPWLAVQLLVPWCPSQTCFPGLLSTFSPSRSLRTLQKILQNFVSASCVSSWHTRALHDKSASPRSSFPPTSWTVLSSQPSCWRLVADRHVCLPKRWRLAGVFFPSPGGLPSSCSQNPRLPEQQAVPWPAHPQREELEFARHRRQPSIQVRSNTWGTPCLL